MKFKRKMFAFFNRQKEIDFNLSKDLDVVAICLISPIFVLLFLLIYFLSKQFLIPITNLLGVVFGALVAFLVLPLFLYKIVKQVARKYQKSSLVRIKNSLS